MFLCLSSGARERYRQDIILALAMSEGMRLQFRYDLKWVSPNIHEYIKNGTCVGTRALISYIDQSDKSKPFDFIPCRFALISDATIHGTTITLGLCLQEFAYADNLERFTNEIVTLSGNQVPKLDQDDHLIGYYFIKIDENKSFSLISSKELVNWERIVKQVSQKAEFHEEKCFYIFQGIRDICNQTNVPLEDDTFKLKPARSYEIELYHYHPTEGKSKAFLRLQTETQSIKITSNPILEINSRYDVKLVRIQTSATTMSEDAVLSIFRGNDLTSDKVGGFDYDIRLIISSMLIRKLLIGVLIGILLAAPQAITIWSNSQLSEKTKAITTIITFFASMAAGIIAAFSLPKKI